MASCDEPMTATYAVVDDAFTAMPRGYAPMCSWRICFPVDVETTDSVYEHQLATSTYLPSGVTTRYFGTAPTWMARSIFSVVKLMR